jgi:predicted nucleic acid-binding protein
LELVVDTNVLLAALLKEAVSRELLLDSRLRLFAPEHLVFETQKHLTASAELRKRIRLTPKDLEGLFFLLTENIETVAEQEFASRMPEALEIAPHREDAPYIALGLSLNISIWSNDQGMGLQDKVRIYSTKELIAILGRRRD